MNETSIITLNENSVRNNVSFLQKKMGKKVKISAVVKANAYGHGIEQIVPLFENAGIDHFSVFDYYEALRVKKSLKGDATIMIMGWIDEKNIQDAVKSGFEFFVFDMERLKIALLASRKLKKQARVHLEAETGMNRSGLHYDEMKKAVAIIKENPENLTVAGFCTHLAGAESISNHLRIKHQIARYKRILKMITENGVEPEYKHMANSAASFVYPKTRLDLVRIGIMMYGFWPSTETFIYYLGNKANRTDPLNRVLGWESRIMSVKEIRTGEYIGYGVSFLAQHDMKTALVPVGYASGYSRSLSNKGRVLIRGQRCDVIGMVNMNMIIVDITLIPEASPGDQVVIIGRQGEMEIKVSAFSDISERLNYEVLTHLSQNIKRKLLK